MALIQHQIIGSEVTRRTRLPTGYAAVQLSRGRRGGLAGALLVLVLLLVVRPLLNRLLALPSSEAAEASLPGLTPEAAAALPPGAAAALALTGPNDMMQQALADAENMANELDQMIDINQVEGRVRASSLKKISELVDQHPEQAVNIMRQWIYQEA